MLTRRKAIAMLPVTDVARARRFYEEQLGLRPKTTLPSGEILYETGGSTLEIYPRAEPLRADHTPVSFEVEDIEAEVGELRRHGIYFEHDEVPEAREQEGLYELGEERCAWVRDPDGNILCVHEGR
jgi:catechol 2,3-dioxygenase-like lactoylglutathione lyase family enzyme